MKKSVSIIIAAVLLAGAIAGFLYWRSDRRKLNIMLDETILLINKRPSSSPHDGVLKYADIDKFFAPHVTITGEDLFEPMKLSREDLKSALVSLHRHVKSLTIDTDNRKFTVNKDAADFSFSAEITIEANNGERSREVRQITGKAVKSDGRWLISDLHIKSAANQQ